MSAPLVPSPLDYIGPRPFAFYPPIKNIAPNEWVLGKASWTEVQIVNAQTGAALWIPRQYVGGVSDAHGAILIVGLVKDLAFRAGSVEPRIKRVIEMPQNVESRKNFAEPLSERSPGPAEVIGIRVENRVDSPMNKALLTFGLGALIVSLIAALLALFNSCAPSHSRRGENQPPASSIKSRILFAAAPC
ncbi:MAG: hypothetical protein JO091_03640 [Acidobacteriaceae bacterium]|nr:hypothetical protein [Acidobacteriaceae bacterium]